MPIIRILLDNNVSRRFVPLLRPHQAVHVSQLGWAALSNGDLIQAAEEHGHQMLITGDRNIRYQQNLTRVGCSIIELSTQHWPTIRESVTEPMTVIEAIQPGAYSTFTLPPPPLRRRPSPAAQIAKT